MGKTMRTARCSHCGIEFERDQYEIKRAINLGRKVCCSCHCASSMSVDHKPAFPKGKMPPQLNAGNKRDEFSPFRMYLRLAKQRAGMKGNQECNITLVDLKEQWEKQQGICPYTGWELANPPTSEWKHLLHDPIKRASLDRIDSSKGYVVGNIQFVAMIANFAKNDFGDEALFEFCRAVAIYHDLV